MKPSFAQQFCLHFGVAEADYRTEMFRRALYPHARGLCLLLRLLDDTYFVADYEAIDGFGPTTHPRHFGLEIQDFIRHPANRRFLRRFFRLRLSATRARAIYREVMASQRDSDASDNPDQSAIAGRPD